jgi:hypothetical protein
MRRVVTSSTGGEDVSPTFTFFQIWILGWKDLGRPSICLHTKLEGVVFNILYCRLIQITIVLHVKHNNIKSQPAGAASPHYDIPNGLICV